MANPSKKFLLHSHMGVNKKNGSVNIRRRVGKTDEFVLCVFTFHVIWRILWSTYFTVKLAVAKTAWQSTNWFQVCLPKCRLWIDNLSYHQSASVHQGDAHMMKPRIFPSYENKILKTIETWLADHDSVMRQLCTELESHSIYVHIVTQYLGSMMDD